MPKISPMMIAPPVIFAGFIALAAIGMFTTDSQNLPSALIGKTAPPITTAALSDFTPVTPDVMATGQVTLVNFWASWCPPCRAEHPKLLEMQSQGMPIIGVNFKDTAGAATEYLSEDGNPFVGVAFDPQGRTAIDWGVTAPPETFILDANGSILFRFAGPLVGSDYEQRFLPQLKAAMGTVSN